MGYYFSPEHANLIAYLTVGGGAAPRTERLTLETFLRSLTSEDEPNIFFAGIREHFERLISSNQNWKQAIEKTAKKLIELLPPGPHEAIIESNDVCRILDALKPFFAGYDLYALVLQSSEQYRDQKAADFFQEAARSSRGYGLILTTPPGPNFLNVLDPFPPLRTLAENPIVAPAVIFWTRLGGTCALPLDEAKVMYRNELLDHLPLGVGIIDQIIRGHARAAQTKRILHMSDLHFGQPEASRRRSYLKGHLATIVKDVDRVVITGDLFDEPDGDLKGEFDEFRSDVERMTDHEVIVVPGNHDARWHGNVVLGFGKNFEQLAKLRWSPVVVDDDLNAVFFCFNSAEGGEFAKGRVSEEQRLAQGTLFDNLRRKRPAIEGYLRIALVHHHPYTYSTAPTAWYEKRLAAVSKREDAFVAFENADEFIKWCASRRISLILHGHKHQPHQIPCHIDLYDSVHDMMVIGCGSTTGVEDTPMRYVVLNYDPWAKRWGAVFYQDVAGDGSSFLPHSVAIDVRRGPPEPL